MSKVEIIEQILNYKGLIKSIDISPDEYLLPLYEIVINSIQSIEDRKTNDGKIFIKIHRTKQQVLNLEEGTDVYNPIEGYTVEDNGVGFTDKRLKAFSIPFTNFNSKKGGKGMGRYTVLACFGSMDIDSYYYSESNLERRILRFDSVNGLQRFSDSEGASQKLLKTVIKLNNYKKEYSKYIVERKIVKKDIAEGIIQHFLLYFINGTAPTIYLLEEEEDINDAIVLNDIYKSVIKIEKTEKDILIPNVKEPFTINYIKNYNGVHAHSIHLCANNRQVGDKETLTKYIPTFKELHDNDEFKYHLSLYITSDFLDDKVHPQRNKLMLPDSSDKKKEYDGVSLQELYNNVADNVRENYSDFIQGAENERNDRIIF